MKNLLLRCSLICFVVVPMSQAIAQKPQQKKANAADQPAMYASVAEEINHDIGEMLGAWQVGDVEAMHKYYAQDATWVSGTYDPPIAGWQNYVPRYLQQRKGFTGIQLVAKNVNIFHYGDTAWACYQWDFMGVNEGKPVTARGQTTLVFVKQNGSWLIVHNHTSQLYPGT